MAVKDGDRVELILRPGGHSDTHPDPDLRGKSFERTVKGLVRRFTTFPPEADRAAAALRLLGEFQKAQEIEDKYGEERWEIVTDDPEHPAIGFDPDTARFK